MTSPTHVAGSDTNVGSRVLISAGQILAAIGLLAVGLEVVWHFGGVLYPKGDAFISSQFVKGMTYEGTFPLWLKIACGLIPALFKFNILVGLWMVFRLFTAYRAGEIFTALSASRIRIIGLMMMLETPLRVGTEAMVTKLVSLWLSPQPAYGVFSFGTAHVYPIVFGLFIVIIGHIMYQAIALSEDNKAIV